MQLATEALDQIRREVWREARRQGQGEVAAELKGAPTRRAYGFHSPQALISLAMLKLGGLCPPLPGRVTVT